MSANFAKLVRRQGWYVTIRQARNLGISFEDTYQMAFGRLPRV